MAISSTLAQSVFAFAFDFLAGFLEGIGVSALVPLASTLTGELSVNEMPPPFNIFPNILVSLVAQLLELC